MATPADPLTPEIAAQIVNFIRSGGFPLVAAEGAGVPRAVYLGWLAEGQKEHAGEPYRSFARDVRQAVALGRLVAECAVYQADPKFWLKYGPGRETPEQPGWGGEGKPAGSELTGPATDGPDWEAIRAVLMRALAPFPEARAAVAETLLTPRS